MEKSNYCPNMFYDTEQVSIGEFNTLQECMNFPIHNIWCINRDEDNLFEKYKSQGNRVLIICCWNRSDKWRFVVGIVKGGNVKYFDLNDLPMDLVQLDFESYLGRDAVAAIKGLNEQTIYNKIKENIKMNKKQTIRLNESQLRQIVNETISEMISELDWKTLVNAAKKAEEKGDPRKEIFLKNATDRIKSQYPNRNDYYSDDTHTTEAHINPYLATKYGYLNYNDYVRANNGGAESEYHKSFGDRGVKGRGAYYLDGVRWPWPTRDGKDDRPPYFEGGKEDDWDNMSNDMEDYYTGKSRYEKGKGWVKNEDRLNEAITQAIRTILG